MKKIFVLFLSIFMLFGLSGCFVIDDSVISLEEVEKALQTLETMQEYAETLEEKALLLEETLTEMQGYADTLDERALLLEAQIAELLKEIERQRIKNEIYQIYFDIIGDEFERLTPDWVASIDPDKLAEINELLDQLEALEDGEEPVEDPEPEE